MILLDRVALLAHRPIVANFPVNDLPVCRSVRAYLRRSVCPVHCGITADRIRVPFGVIGRTGPGMRQVHGGVWGSAHGKGYFWGRIWARHCIQCGLYGVRCETVPQPSKLRFGVVRAVGRGIAVLDGGQRSPTGRGVLGFLFSILTMEIPLRRRR